MSRGKGQGWPWRREISNLCFKFPAVNLCSSEILPQNLGMVLPWCTFHQQLFATFLLLHCNSTLNLLLSSIDTAYRISVVHSQYSLLSWHEANNFLITSFTIAQQSPASVEVSLSYHLCQSSVCQLYHIQLLRSSRNRLQTFTIRQGLCLYLHALPDLFMMSASPHYSL